MLLIYKKLLKIVIYELFKILYGMILIWLLIIGILVWGFDLKDYNIIWWLKMLDGVMK